VLIWAGWAVAARGFFLSPADALATPDLVALRFMLAGAITLPRAALRPPPVRALGAWRTAVVVTAGGFTFSLCNTGGFAFAPAAHGGALTSPLGAVFTALLAALVLNERLSRARGAGLALILAGAVALLAAVLAADTPASVFIGHALFVAAGLQWAVYTVVMRGARLPPLDALSLACVGAALAYLPAWALLRGPAALLGAPAGTVLTQAVLHGLMSQVISILLFNLAVTRLGAARPATCGALVPPVVALGAALLLGEVPAPAELPGLALLTLGVWLASRPAAR
jgi:drug/metabolite transporter (DMT)-like permease